jgi:hypothetical protein
MICDTIDIPRCEATAWWGQQPYLDAIPCGRPAVAECAYCGMKICERHQDGEYCAGTDCRAEARKEDNAAILLAAWRIGEGLLSNAELFANGNDPICDTPTLKTQRGEL